MTSPRVLFVAPSSYTLSGLAVWLDYLLPGLRSRGWDACLGLVSGPVHNRPQDYLASHPGTGWLPIHTDTCTPEGRRRAVAKAIRETAPDLVVAVNIPDTYRAIASLRQKRHRTPRVVMSLHGIQGDLIRDVEQYREVLDAVVATNRLAAALAREVAGMPAGRVLYAPYGVSQPEVAGAVPDLPPQPLRIVHSGRLEQDQKRVRDLPAILKGLDAAGIAWRLRIAGTGPEEAWLRQQLDVPAWARRVEFLGHVPSERMAAAVYAGADVLLITPAWETGPLVVWEALALGLPVVSSAYVGSGLEAALHDGINCLLFEVGDTQGAVAALARLARERTLRETLQANGRQLIRERYSVGASVAAWDQALHATSGLPELPAPRVVPSSSSSGRLDRWLGPWLAETLRVLTRRRWRDADAGGEWPHSHSGLNHDEDGAFWRTAARLDRRDSQAQPGPATGCGPVLSA